MLLKESSVPLTVREIVGRIHEKHPGVLAHHRDPSVSLRIVLRRLVAYREAEEVLNAKGLRAWKWAPRNESGSSAAYSQSDDLQPKDLPANVLQSDGRSAQPSLE
jgi:hypothetical protein